MHNYKKVGPDKPQTKDSVAEKLQYLIKEKSFLFRDEDMRDMALAMAVDPTNQYLQTIFDERRNELEMDDTFDPQLKNQPTQKELEPVTSAHIPLFKVRDTDAVIPYPLIGIANHILISGPSGTKKTTCIKHFLIGSAGKTTALVFDGSNEQLWNLAKVEPVRDKGIVRPWIWTEVRIGTLEIDLMETLQHHMNKVIDNFDRNFKLVGSSRYGKRMLKLLYQEFGVVDSKAEIFPCLGDWLDIMDSPKGKARSSKEADYKTTFSSVLSDLIDSTGDVFNCSSSDCLDRLFQKGTINIIGVQGLPLPCLGFLVTFITDWLYLRRARL